MTVAGVDYGPYRLTDIDVLDAGAAVIGTMADVADDTTLKSGWNWNLVNNDGSMGIHNPFFVTGALIAARDELIQRLSGVGGGPRPTVPSIIDRPQGRLGARPGAQRQHQR